jgi:hypothetical protein
MTSFRDENPDLSEWIRGVRIFPYRKGRGPTFQLHIYACGRMNEHPNSKYDWSRDVVGHLFIQENSDGTKVVLDDCRRRKDSILVLGASDSVMDDDTIVTLLEYLGTHPRDMEEEQLAELTPLMREFRTKHGEVVGYCALEPEEAEEEEPEFEDEYEDDDDDDDEPEEGSDEDEEDPPRWVELGEPEDEDGDNAEK